MADVGRLAGVSHQTVSRVINNHPNVRPGTRQRVLEAMLALGYRPNSAARALATGRSHALGVVTFDTVLYGPASTLVAIERAAHAAGYFIIVASLTSLDRPSVASAIERLRRHGVEGILAITADVEGAEALRETRVDVPLVAVQAGPEDGVPLVAIDQIEGAAQAVRHLLELGHRTVWHISGPAESLESRQRLHGWRSALRAAGAEIPDPLSGDWSARAGYLAGVRLLGERGVSAVFTANDQMAIGLLSAIHERGLSVPAEISVVGFDDIPEAPYLTPALTTVRQDFDRMGSGGLDLLLRMLHAGELPRSPEPIRPELVIRSSTAIPPTGARCRSLPPDGGAARTPASRVS
jgi:DNA-binding LacI/PurR family transcriptional regulator